MRHVPLVRRNLLADPRRLVVSALGVGLALMLILLLDGLWAGIRSQVTTYEDHSGAQLYVVTPGTLNLFADSSIVPRSAVDTVRAIPDVRWAAPVRTAYTILDLHNRKVAVALVGSVPGEPGGPWALAEGRAPEADDEVVVDSVLADRHDLHLGDAIAVSGATMRVVGMSLGTAGFMTGFVFVTHHATELALRAPDTTSVILVGTDQPAAVRARLAAIGLTAVDHAALRASSLALATKIYGTPMRLMVGVGFAAGTLVIALTSYTTVAERRREYGIVKAIGATPTRLTALALGQTLSLALIGAVAAAALFLGGRAVIEALRPQFVVVVTAPGVLRAAVAGLAMAVLAAIVPARRLAHLDPAAAFRDSS
ncbi:MAG TPA: ABC transporter permease [Ilumatobacteraceae bacterium]|nr:ABC transporter permease [Ilumatobacteraceae bacterium]